MTRNEYIAQAAMHLTVDPDLNVMQLVDVAIRLANALEQMGVAPWEQQEEQL